jgi:lambda repressor-like predicted transcriptional regulator
LGEKIKRCAVNFVDKPPKHVVKCHLSQSFVVIKGMANTLAKKANQEDWHPADIKAALEKKGWTLKALAAYHGLKGSSSFSHVFERSFPLNEKRIADALGVKPQSIWPSRYYPDGTKKPRGRRGSLRLKSTALISGCNGNLVAGL